MRSRIVDQCSHATKNGYCGNDGEASDHPSIARLQIGEFTLVICRGVVIRIERDGEVCFRCRIPIAPRHGKPNVN